MGINNKKKMNQEEYIEKCFKGEIIYGDDFNIIEIKKWFELEKEGYSSLNTIELEDLNRNIYNYHQLNKAHGFKYIDSIKNFQNVLGIGSATGIEFDPIINKINSLYILEPSNLLRAKKIGKLDIVYEEPTIEGKINFESNKFDLITSFGVLHHIPNVTFVISEISRVTKNGGIFMFREPIISMGDWRKKRIGLTKNERGIPINILKKIIKENNFEIITESYCFTLTTTLNRVFTKFFKHPIYYYKIYILLDKILSNFLRFNVKYHTSKKYNKLYPQNVFFVLKKRNLD